jgi:Ca-activated chloride channel family protein
VSGPTALYLRALLAPQAEPLGIPLHWIVSAEGQPQASLFEAWTANPVVPVAPGRYVVEVSNGLVSARDTVVVRKKRPLAVPIVLGAGAVRVRVVAQKTGAPLPDAIVTLSKTADGPPVAVFRPEETPPLLPVGRFFVRAELGLARSEPQILNVAAGPPATVDIPLNAGRLRLTTAGREGVSPLEAPLFIVTEDDPPRGRREVARSAARQAEFVLPPGTYYVLARQGSVEARERLEVGSGDTVRGTLTAAAGRLSLSTTVAGPAALAGDLVSYTIKRLDDPTQDVIATSRQAPVLFLPSGRYRVEGRYGLTNVETVREIDIRGGQALQLSLEHQIAALRLRLAGAAEVSWEVRDEAGRTVWTSDQAETVATLQAGRYLVTASTLGKRRERAVDLRAGESRLVEIGRD